MKNKNLHEAKKAKNDEFYTLYSDIENEVQHYKDQFKNKIVYCNCDNYKLSNFFKFFKDHFEDYQLKKLISTCYIENGKGLKAVMSSKDKIEFSELNGDGDFASDECKELLQESDIICTNPPFSLFRKYISTIMEYEKSFLIVGNQNAITYKEIFPLLKDNKIYVASERISDFIIPDNCEIFNVGYTNSDGKKIVKFGNICWYSNMMAIIKKPTVTLTQKYDPTKYPKYDNYDAINVNKVIDIPVDYYGVMGVPITFLDKYNPSQFEIIGLGISNSGLDIGVSPYKPEHKQYRKEVQHRGAVDGDLYMVDVNNKPVVPYARLLIKKKDEVTTDDFEIIGEANHGQDNEFDLFKPIIDGKEKFKKLLIKRKNENEKGLE